MTEDCVAGVRYKPRRIRGPQAASMRCAHHKKHKVHVKAVRKGGRLVRRAHCRKKPKK